jgi:hypothetical protein
LRKLLDVVVFEGRIRGSFSRTLLRHSNELFQNE